MTHHHEHGSTAFDSDFNGITELQWLPWVGQYYSERPQGVRLLIVGESHYDWEADGSRDALQDPNFTRLVVSEHAITPEGPSPTFAISRFCCSEQESMIESGSGERSILQFRPTVHGK